MFQNIALKLKRGCHFRTLFVHHFFHFCWFYTLQFHNDDKDGEMYVHLDQIRACGIS